MKLEVVALLAYAYAPAPALHVPPSSATMLSRSLSLCFLFPGPILPPNRFASFSRGRPPAGLSGAQALLSLDGFIGDLQRECWVRAMVLPHHVATASLETDNRAGSAVETPRGDGPGVRAVL